MREKKAAYNHTADILPTKADFIAEKAPRLYVDTLSASQSWERMKKATSTVFFLMKGSLTCQFSLQDKKQAIGTRRLFFLPAGEGIRVRIDSPALLLGCTIEKHLLPAFRLSSENIRPDNHLAEGPLYTLPMHPLLYAEASTTIHALQSVGPDNPTYLRHKAIALLQLLLQLYTPEQIRCLFAPLLLQTSDFREEVLKNYSDTLRVKDLCKLLHIPPTTLNRKFKTTFQMSPQKWFAARRKENLLHDILYTRLTIVEISDKYRLSPNYLMKFCKDSFGMTLTQLREQGMQPHDPGL